ncbi:hypothetical protein CONLIGDRAFT_621163 [Coniochaeta ligniaria NRRL 30616]|uniref:FAD-binding FR-type domain-containing protein n=1 Tax=Coniochaeta ligniaria NRRL 30616 TaxID=1408157 RepID=A0A1J7JHC3_9PEZI|nr:hypothetical protein CONLIGDRAFT_621163 [Coniochaeta ligniaria NRRL 30616]
MQWPYHIVKLSAAEKHERRVSLDHIGLYAQFSAILIISCFLLARLAQWIILKATASTKRRADYDVVPTADTSTRRKATPSPRRWLSTKLQQCLWWLGDEAAIGRHRIGRRDEWIFGGIWTSWLLFLCVAGTGEDYQHLTKRFGQVATSQFPLQYLLAAKRLNPVAFAFRTSHENINRWHRVLGYITYILALLHGAFYLNYYIQVGGLGHAFLRSVPVLGMLGLLGMTLLSTTALSVIRHYSYRIFIVTHLVIALAIPPIIWFHVHHARLYMGEALCIFLADVAARKLHTVKASAAIEPIPGTELIKIVAQVPPETLRNFRAYPASHAYLSITSRWRPGVIASPFTVAAVREEAGELTFVARLRAGPLTKTLERLTGVQSHGVGIGLSIEGPYGAARYFPNLAGPNFEKVLLVAGGVGATFILPLFESILTENPVANVKMVWAVRDVAEATWSTLATGRKSVDDDRVHLFVTSRSRESSSLDGSELGNIEMDRLEKAEVSISDLKIPVENLRRPDLQMIVDDVFQGGSHGRIAVVVCGPAQMARDVRKAVGFWIKLGRDVWFHDENFGW